MLAIAPHKRGAIFLSTVDGGAGCAQNSPEQFLDRLEASGTAKARPIGLSPSCGFSPWRGLFISPQSKCNQEENDQDTPQDRKPTLNGTGGRKASAHADSNKYERMRDSSPIERKSYRANWKAGDALNDRRRNSSANCAGQQSATIDRWQKTARWGPIAAITAHFVKIRHHGAPRRRNEAPPRKSWSKQSAPEFV